MTFGDVRCFFSFAMCCVFLGHIVFSDMLCCYVVMWEVLCFLVTLLSLVSLRVCGTLLLTVWLLLPDVLCMLCSR